MLLKDVSSFEVYRFEVPEGYGDAGYIAGIEKVLEDLDKLPIIDAVPVVRCKHCDCWCDEFKVGRTEFGNVTAPCSEWSNEDGYIVYTGPDEFCSRGERRTDEP